MINTPSRIVDSRGLIKLEDGSYVDTKDMAPEDIDALRRSLADSKRMRSAQEYRDSLAQNIENIFHSSRETLQ